MFKFHRPNSKTLLSRAFRRPGSEPGSGSEPGKAPGSGSEQGSAELTRK